MSEELNEVQPIVEPVAEEVMASEEVPAEVVAE